MDAVNLTRGLWNLILTHGTWTLRGGDSENDPIGAVFLGPIHTLHTLDGKHAVEKLAWVERDYPGKQRIFDGIKWKEMEKLRKKFMRQIKVLPYGKDLRKLLIRYASAIDHANTDLTTIHLWGILERITDTVGTNYDETIKRAISMFVRQAEIKEMLLHVRFHRNQFVHGGRSGYRRDQTAYAIKQVIDSHLTALIENAYQVATLKEYAEILKFPTDLKTLTERRNQMTRAIRYRLKAHAKRP